MPLLLLFGMLVVAPFAPSDRTIRIPCASVKVNVPLLSGPSSSSRLVDLVECGHDVTVLEGQEKHPGWLEIRTSQGRVGFMYSLLLGEGNTATPNNPAPIPSPDVLPGVKHSEQGAPSVIGSTEIGRVPKVTLNCISGDSVSIFDAPGSITVVHRAKCGEQAFILEKIGERGQVKIRLATGEEGFVGWAVVNPIADLTVTGPPANGSTGVGAAVVLANGVGAAGSGRGPSVSQPIKIYDVQPQYTQVARNANVSGTVLINGVVGPDGRVHNPKVLKSLGMGLDEKAIEAISQWKFKPGMKDGMPVPVYAEIEVNFKLERSPSDRDRPSILSDRDTDLSRPAERVGSSSRPSILQGREEGATETHRDAERSDDASALYETGLKYIAGNGVLQDFVLAHMWLNLAAAQGFKGAATKRDELAKHMTASQIEEAQRLARNWKRN